MRGFGTKYIGCYYINNLMNGDCFRPEGFTAKVLLKFRRMGTREKYLKSLEDEIKDGYLGNIQVKPELGVSTETGEPDSIDFCYMLR